MPPLPGIHEDEWGHYEKVNRNPTLSERASQCLFTVFDKFLTYQLSIPCTFRATRKKWISSFL